MSPESRKLSYREQRELDALPGKIESLEAEQRALNAKIADPAFYSEPAETIRAAVARLESIEAELSDVYTRWDALESRR
jgi:ATP-binding cassette subfamily F protein uup